MLPAEVSSALRCAYSGEWDYKDACTALAVGKRDGFDQQFPVLADEAQAALAPIPAGKLIDRLTLLGMSMMHGKSSEQVRAWMHETARLLADLPQSILFEAIDECVKEPGRVFAPTVGEIREKAAEPLRKLERTAARLRRVAMLIEEGVDVPAAEHPEARPWNRPIPDFDETQRCTPEQAASVLSEFGLRSGVLNKVAANLGPRRLPTRADYIAMGVDPAFLDRSRTSSESSEMPC